MTKQNYLVLALVSVMGLVACTTRFFGVFMPKSMQKPVSATFFQQTVIDLGYVDQNRKMIHESQVTNPTKDVIVISTSVKSCSCVGIELQKSRLQPGETISWALSWDSGSKKGPTQDVVQFIIENDTGKVIAYENVHINANVIPQCELSITEVSWLPDQQDQLVNLVSSSKNNFKIIEVYCDNADWVICVNEDKKSFKFKPKDKQKTSLSKASILVETDAIVSTSRWLRLEIQTHPGE